MRALGKALYLLLIAMALLPRAGAQTTAFTYQGYLSDAGSPAVGKYDLRFALYNSAENGSLVGKPLTNAATSVSKGLFTVSLDFGANIFTGASRWLEIAARTNGRGAFTTLSPRQSLAPSPYALFAASASSVPATNLTGIIPDSLLSPNVALLGASNAYAGSFAGNGIGLTNLDGAKIKPGTLRLPFVTLSAKGVTNRLSTMANDGMMFGPDTVGTKTCGIQEAINSLSTATNTRQPAGGTICFAPGIYYTTETIQVPDRHVLYSLNLVGAGQQSCGITYVGAVPKTVLMVGSGRSYGTFDYSYPVNFGAKDMWFSSALNAKMSLLYLNGTNGGVWKVNIEECWFAPWQMITNFLVAITNTTVKADLTPIEVRCNLGGDTTIVNKCTFYKTTGVYWATDHGTMNDNFFGYTGWHTSYAASSAYGSGASIICGEPGPMVNGQEDWSFHRNYFMSCGAAYYIGPGSMRANPVSYEDGLEGTPTGVFTQGARWTLINPMVHNGNRTPPMDRTLLDNSGKVIGPASTNLVRIVDLTKGSPVLQLSAVSALGKAMVGAQAAAGLGASVEPEILSGTEVATSLRLHTGSSGLAAGTVLLCRFDENPPASNVPVVVVSASSASAALVPVWVEKTSTNFSLNVTAPLQGDTDYVWDIHLSR